MKKAWREGAWTQHRGLTLLDHDFSVGQRVHDSTKRTTGPLAGESLCRGALELHSQSVKDPQLETMSVWAGRICYLQRIKKLKCRSESSNPPNIMDSGFKTTSIHSNME